MQPAELGEVGMLTLRYVTFGVGLLQEFTSDVTLLVSLKFGI